MFTSPTPKTYMFIYQKCQCDYTLQPVEMSVVSATTLLDEICIAVHVGYGFLLTSRYSGYWHEYVDMSFRHIDCLDCRCNSWSLSFSKAPSHYELYMHVDVPIGVRADGDSKSDVQGGTELVSFQNKRKIKAKRIYIAPYVASESEAHYVYEIFQIRRCVFFELELYKFMKFAF